MKRFRNVFGLLSAILTLTFIPPAVPVSQAAGETFVPSPFNGYLVYLSPSSQSNVGCNNYSESAGARAIAYAAKDKLYSWGYAVKIGNSDPTTNINESNAWKSSIHVPIHSNAKSFDCSGANPANGGTVLMYQTGDTNDQRLANYIYPELRTYSPGTSDAIGTDQALSAAGQLGELRSTTMPAAYVEAEYHTYGPGVTWLQGATNVGGKIAIGIDKYFGSPRCGVNKQCPQAPQPVAADTAPTAPQQPVETSAFVTSPGQAFPTLNTALTQVLKGPSAAERARGVESWFSEATADKLKSVTITNDGIVIVDFADFRSIIPNASTTTGANILLSQLNSTVFQFSNAKSVIYQFDGSCNTFYAWLQSMCHPLTR